VITAEPADKPVTIPVVLSTVATDRLADVQTPPVVVLASVNVVPEHIVVAAVGVMAAGAPTTEMFKVAAGQEPNA